MVDKRLIYVCGLIGVGKTTILNQLKKYVKIVVEPMNEIKKYLSNPINKNIVKLQYMFIKHHNIILDDFDKNDISVVVEGSPMDNIIFAKLSNMTKSQLIKYKILYIKLIKRLEQYNITRIYLDIDPITALKRIQNRGRIYEKNITKEYLNELKYQQTKKQKVHLTLLNYTKKQKDLNVICILEMLY